MDIPNNHELPRRIAGNNHNPDALRRMLRPNNNGFFRRWRQRFVEIFDLICQGVKYLILLVLGFLAICYGAKWLLLFLIWMQDKP